MGFFDRFFRKEKKPDLEVELSPSLRAQVDLLKQPAVHLVETEEESFSRLGGLPLVPKDFVWPLWNKKPLAFLGQLDMAKGTSVFPGSSLPSSGYLYFFYDQEQSTWGFDPQDKGSSRVIYAEGAASDFVFAERPAGLSEDACYPEKYLDFALIDTYPDWSDGSIRALKLDKAYGDAYSKIGLSVYGNQPQHHLLGISQPVQSPEMDVECQLVTNGLYCGDASGYKDPRAAELRAGAAKWQLLLQLDSDDDAGMMWGDCGMIYFWIRKEDLRNKNFAAVWMILQCS